MKKGHILHNPNAGNQEKSKKDLIALLKSKGLECGYSSTKKIDWQKFETDSDFIVVAGGDGTVRKVAVKLIEKDRFKKRLPILLLALGTANNVAKSLGIEGKAEEMINNIENEQTKKYDVGRISGIKEESIMLESMGFGVFPMLVKKMKERPELKELSAGESLETALETLHKLITSMPAMPYKIKVDDMEHGGNYILVEVMNTPSFGPNLNISPNSDPGDGMLEVVLVPEQQREEFASYVSHKISGVEKGFVPVTFRGTKVSITGGPGPIHVDDRLLELEKNKKIRIGIEPGMMEFFV